MPMTAFLLMTLMMAGVSAQKNPTTGYAPVNRLKMYYAAHAPHAVTLGFKGSENKAGLQKSKTRLAGATRRR